MKRVLIVMLGLVMVAVLGVQAAGSGDDTRLVLKWKTMAGVVPPYTGTANPIREVNGGGLPWSIRKAEGVLRSNGQLRIIVKGLVLADDPVVPAALRLTNPVPFFKGVVSCQSIGTDPEGHPIPTTINVSTDPFPASPAGDSKIKATVDLPWPCFAPIVFVTNPGGSWFAVTGR